MTTKEMTAEEIRTFGLEALYRELGPVGMVRFLQQFETGKGDYSVERHELLKGMDVTRLVEEARKLSKQREERLAEKK